VSAGIRGMPSSPDFRSPNSTRPLAGPLVVVEHGALRGSPRDSLVGQGFPFRRASLGGSSRRPGLYSPPAPRPSPKICGLRPHEKGSADSKAAAAPLIGPVIARRRRKPFAEFTVELRHFRIPTPAMNHLSRRLYFVMPRCFCTRRPDHGSPVMFLGQEHDRPSCSDYRSFD